MLSAECYKELEDVLGPENVSQEPAVMDSYAWQSSFNFNPTYWIPRPEAVVLPGSTEDVVAIVKICNKYDVKFKAISSGWGAHAGPGSEGVIQVDLRRMDNIIEIDEKNMYAVVEPCAIGGQIRAEAMKRGLNVHMISAGAVSSPLASATSAWGCCWDGVVSGWSPRTVLGVEWVLPTGEVMRLGTLGSDDGWFCGDGPGPSLRGLMRGRCGTFSGNGIFTKCALKLYNWPGPAIPECDGLLLDAEMTIPENFKVYWTVFKDMETYRDAALEITEEGIGYISLKLNLGTLLCVLMPHLVKTTSWKKVTSIRNLFYGVQHGYVFIVGGNSKRDLEFQESVIRDVVTKRRGVMLNLDDFGLSTVMYWGLISGAFPPSAYRMGGQFYTGWGQDDAWDAMVSWDEQGQKVKQSWIDKDGCVDDLADCAFDFFCEEGNMAHSEEVWFYDPRKKEHSEATLPINVDFLLQSLENCMELGGNMEPKIRKLLSPLLGNYNVWQKKIQDAFDPGRAADDMLYTFEEDLDLAGLDPDKVKRALELVAKYAWTPEGTPPA